MAGPPVSAIRHETADQVPADWSGGSSRVHQVDTMVSGVSLSTREAKRTHLIQDICKVGCDIIRPCLLNFMFLGQMGGSDRVGR